MRDAIRSAPRVTLVNLVTTEQHVCLLNPTAFAEKVQVGYNRLSVPGLTHQVLQFQNTGNRRVDGVEFYLDRLVADQADAPDILAFRRFLRALTLPVLVAGQPTAPPRVLLVWPAVLTMEAVLTDVEFAYRSFGGDGRVLTYSASVSFEEILDVRRTAPELDEERR